MASAYLKSPFQIILRKSPFAFSALDEIAPKLADFAKEGVSKGIFQLKGKIQPS